jgi:FlaA1/EpsC-like NDP-sugar epimerase
MNTPPPSTGLVARLGSRIAQAARLLLGLSPAPARALRLLIIGAGDAGETVARDILTKRDGDYDIIGFIDDDPAKVGRHIQDVPVLGTRADLVRIVAHRRPDEVLVAIPSAPPALVRQIVECLQSHKVPIKTLPRLRDLTSGAAELRDIRTLAFEDLLARAPVGLDSSAVVQLIAGRRVLVTGAGGSIGGELCRQIASMMPASLVMLDRYENGLHAIGIELEAEGAAGCIRPVIADVTDAARINAVFARYQPEIVFHAAAHKHVPLMQGNPCEAIKNNVTGSRIVAEAAERYGVNRFILVSTDKAVNPTSIMGASKRLAELAIRTQAAGSGTTFAIVRFGNVLGSNGSVVPVFLRQIRQGGPVTVTHPEVRRFFMLVSEAVQLVLHAAAHAANGATYLLEMGEQVKVLDMARHLIRLSGYVPDRDIAIEFIGLRPGEKLSEELVGDGEAAQPSAIDKILRVVDVVPRSTLGTRESIAKIEQRAAENDAHGVVRLLTRLLPEYNRPRAGGAEPLRSPSPLAPAAVASTPGSSLAQQRCPVCHVRGLGRARARGLFERVARAMSERRLFVCDECGWRGWLTPVDIAVAAQSRTAASPDLFALDEAMELIPFTPNRSFSPRHLN